MPLPQLPLRHYPSAQTMRQLDGPHVPPGHENICRDQEKGAYSPDRSTVNVHDFQTHHRTSSRRPSTPRPILSPRLDANGAPPLPDSQQYWRNSPTVPRLGPLCVPHRTDQN